jgi:NACalpha-BTF3-like transcription factor
MKRRLKCEFDQVDDDVVSFVLSQCNNDESAAIKALRTQVTNLISKE